MSAICRNRALCVVASVLNKCIMARNSMANMVIEVSDVEGVASGTGGVVRESIEIASSIDGVVGASGIDSAGCSSCCGCSICGGTGNAGLGGVAIGAE